MADRQSTKGTVDIYKPSEHDEWMLKLKWQLRRESRFAEEILNGEHQCPEGAGELHQSQPLKIQGALEIQIISN